MKGLFVMLALLAGCSVRDDGRKLLIECPGMAAFELRQDGGTLRDEAGRRVIVPSTCKLTVL